MDPDVTRDIEHDVFVADSAVKCSGVEFSLSLSKGTPPTAPSSENFCEGIDIFILSCVVAPYDEGVGSEVKSSS